MKFLCDNCQAQYMISDDKVGPAGVRVRCKKCSHVIFVKKVENERPTEDSTVVVSKEKMAELSTSSALEPEAAAEPTATPQPESPATQPPDASQPPAGIEDEIGQALDSMFSDSKKPAAASPGPTSSGGSRPPVVLGSPPLSGSAGSPFGALNGEKPSILGLEPPELTQIASPSPAANSTPPGPASKSSEWFVAIQDEQVGPLAVEDIKARFEKGEVGSDTLVWSTGLTDWRPLSNVEELAEQILPRKEIVRISRLPIPSEPPKDAPRKEAIAFRPSAASALASLASMAKEELATVGRTPSNPPRSADSGGSRVSEAMPEGFLAGLPAFTPAPMPAAAAAAEPPGRERSAGASLDDYRLSPLAQTKPRARGRSFLGVAIVAIIVMAGLGAGAYYFMAAREQALEARLDRQQRENAQRQQADEKAAQDALAAAKAAELAAQKIVPAAPAPNPAQPTTPAPSPSVPPSALGLHPPPPTVAATREDPRDKRGKHGKGGRGGSESPSPEPAAQPSAHADKAPPSKGSDDFLAAGDVDKEFAKELEGGGDGKASAKHGPYIPPAPGQADLPVSLSQSDIVGAVTQHRDAFAKCVQEQKRRDPGASGTVVMRWRIRPDGRSSDIAAKGEDYADSPLASCFKSQIGKLRFGAYRGAQMAPIEFPFSF